MTIWVSGSIAYDVILDYPEKFADKINPKKIHALSISFTVNKIKKSFGGTAANIVYNLLKLGIDAGIIGSIGKDGKDYFKYLKNLGVKIECLKISNKNDTASAFVMTDTQDNQISAFYTGAVSEKVCLPKLALCDWPIICAEGKENMIALARHYQKSKHKYIFDPGQAITILSSEELAIGIKGASILIGNDYEIDYVLHKINKKRLPCVIIRTLGPKGSEIIYPNGKKDKIKAVKVENPVDPTGAGDAYRAGLIKGVISGYNLKVAGQIASTVASFAVEKYGTQEHKLSWRKVLIRYKDNFPPQEMGRD